MPATGCWSIDWLGELIRKIDDLWYEGRLLKHLEDSYGGLRLELDVESKSVAGYVVETADRKRISLHMNRDLFVELFKQRDVAYHSGGNICRTRGSCFLGVLLHETMHLLVTLADKLGVRRETDEHDEHFRKLIDNWFGQQEILHGLIHGYRAKQDIATIRKALRRGLHVEVFQDGKWYPATVVNKGRDVSMQSIAKMKKINAKTKKALMKANISTLRDLVNADPLQVDVPELETLQDLAKEFIDSYSWNTVKLKDGTALDVHTGLIRLIDQQK